MRKMFMRAHRWMLVCTFVFCRRKGRREANSWPRLHTIRRPTIPLDAPAATSQQKQLELSPLRCGTLSVSPPVVGGGRSEWEKKVRGPRWVSESKCIYIKKHFNIQKCFFCFFMGLSREKESEPALKIKKTRVERGWTVLWRMSLKSNGKQNEV